MAVKAGKLVQKGARNRRHLRSSTNAKKKKLSVNLNHNVVGYNKQLIKAFTPSTRILIN